MVKLFFQGGLLMHQLTCLLITLIILLERSVFWIKTTKKEEENLNALLKALNSNKYSEFINLCMNQTI